MPELRHPPIDETDLLPTSESDREKFAVIARHMRAIIEALGLDPSDPNLQETHERVAMMYLEMFHGLSEGAEPKVTVFPNEERYTAMVQRDPSLLGWTWRAMARNPRVYARGTVRHPDHATITLREWCRVLLNTETDAPSMPRMAFLD